MSSSPAPNILRIAVAQLNPTVGDVLGNLAKAREARAEAARHGADLVLFTELFLAGYPPEDLVLKPAFLAACEKAATDIAGDTADGGPGVIIGTPLKRKSGVHNSVIVADGGKAIAERFKIDLPNYGEFDEKRVFQAAPDIPGPVNFRGVRLGIPICEDIWGDHDVCETLAESGAEMLGNLEDGPQLGLGRDFDARRAREIERGQDGQLLPSGQAPLPKAAPGRSGSGRSSFSRCSPCSIIAKLKPAPRKVGMLNAITVAMVGTVRTFSGSPPFSLTKGSSFSFIGSRPKPTPSA